MFINYNFKKSVQYKQQNLDKQTRNTPTMQGN